MKQDFDLVCISHLRWDFVFQRPQHLMTRAAKNGRVYFVEEPIYDAASARMEMRRDESGVIVCIPHLPEGTTESQYHASLRVLLQEMLDRDGVKDFVLWIYTPMPLPALRALEPAVVIYDCMDELANFKFAPPELRQRERELFDWADHVFTGGYSLWESKRKQHDSAHPFPSSVDVAHFAKARGDLPEPEDMRHIPHPRIGFYGVVDERFDIDLIRCVADVRPEWQLVILGPVVKIDPADLPRNRNIHYLGQKSYQELPTYLAHWDAAMLPFAINEATEYISPTKTPEYLAAGKPVVSTAIRDVVRPYGEKDLVLIARTLGEFVRGIEECLSDPADRRARADAYVGRMSWDRTWRQMRSLIIEALETKNGTAVPGARIPSTTPTTRKVDADSDGGASD
ncbi:MAG TPA: glycosyltransferase family 1 protein [Deinococcales bacterium]|nr:glycosyltransferase family 1 protein [Deinococcales bacterium]